MKTVGGVTVPAAAFCRLKAWNWGDPRLPLPSVIDKSSLRISMLSLRLEGVMPALPVFDLVFLLGILVGNFIFSFLLFSYGGRQVIRVSAEDSLLLEPDSQEGYRHRNR